MLGSTMQSLYLHHMTWQWFLIFVGSHYGTCFMSSFGICIFEVAPRFLENLSSCVLRTHKYLDPTYKI